MHTEKHLGVLQAQGFCAFKGPVLYAIDLAARSVLLLEG